MFSTLSIMFSTSQNLFQCLSLSLGLCVGILLGLAGEVGVMAAEVSKSSQSTHFSVKRLERPYDPYTPLEVADVPIVFANGILFTYVPPAAGSSAQTQTSSPLRVAVTGEFVDWNWRIDMLPSRRGIYQAFVPMQLAAGVYTYKFVTNGIFFNDPKQAFITRATNGALTSAFALERAIEYHAVSPRQVSREGAFTFYLKDEGYREVYWMGTENLWAPAKDSMSLRNGYWQITKYLRPDQPYYLFVTDGVPRLDPLNENAALASFGKDVSVSTSPVGYFLYEQNAQAQ